MKNRQHGEVFAQMASSQFDALAEDYDAARPSYPGGVYQALEDTAGPLAGKLVLEGGAGTGIATRELAARGARIVAVDIAERILHKAREHSPEACFLLADASARRCATAALISPASPSPGTGSRATTRQAR